MIFQNDVQDLIDNYVENEGIDGLLSKAVQALKNVLLSTETLTDESQFQVDLLAMIRDSNQNEQQNTIIEKQDAILRQMIGRLILTTTNPGRGEMFALTQE
jgi:hypothetical protein